MSASRRWIHLLIGSSVILVIALLVFLPRSDDSAHENDGETRARKSHGTTLTGKTAHPSGKFSSRTLREKLEASQDVDVEAKALQAYLAGKNRDVESLITAYRLGGKDPELLKEALERFPNHPLVLQTALQEEQNPAKRLGYLATLKQADPGNAMPGLLMADALFATGKREEALDALEACAGLPYDSYFRQIWQAEEEAHLAMGLSPDEAKLRPLYSISGSAILRARKLVDELKKVRASSEYSGDPEAVVALRVMQQDIGRGLRTSGQNIVEQLVGISIEKQSLTEAGDPSALEEIERLDALKVSLTNGGKRMSELMVSDRVPDTDWVLYADRVKIFGEQSATQWMLEKYPEEP